MDTKGKVNIWWTYVVLFTLLLVVGPTTHLIRQALLGHPLDINYSYTKFGYGIAIGRNGLIYAVQMFADETN